MATEADFAVAVGIFFVFIAALFVYVTNYLSSYSGLASTSELRTIAFDIFSSMFSGKGIPTNWEVINNPPFKVGLITDLYRIPILVSERGNIERINVTVNTTITFDNNCNQKAWNNTIRVYENDTQLPSSLINSTFCSQQYINTSILVFNISLVANQTKVVSVYYSPENSTNASTRIVTFSNPTNINLLILPEEKLTAISYSKLKALRNSTYSDILQTLISGYKFKLEISDT